MLSGGWMKKPACAALSMPVSLYESPAAITWKFRPFSAFTAWRFWSGWRSL
jgi:hypothetical protein